MSDQNQDLSHRAAEFVHGLAADLREEAHALFDPPPGAKAEEAEGPVVPELPSDLDEQLRLCPHCGERTLRPLVGMGEGVAEYECSHCGWVELPAEPSA